MTMEGDGMRHRPFPLWITLTRVGQWRGLLYEEGDGNG
jgi:hypothetical protein